MNFERLKQVRDVIIANPDKFDQNAWLHNCGTPACIAGWAAHLSLQDGESLGWCAPAELFAGLSSEPRIPLVVDADNEFVVVGGRAREWLGLSHEEADTLFDASPIPGGEWVSVHDAVATLDHAIETGNIVWGIDCDV